VSKTQTLAIATALATAALIADDERVLEPAPYHLWFFPPFAARFGRLLVCHDPCIVRQSTSYVIAVNAEELKFTLINRCCHSGVTCPEANAAGGDALPELSRDSLLT